MDGWIRQVWKRDYTCGGCLWSWMWCLGFTVTWAVRSEA